MSTKKLLVMIASLYMAGCNDVSVPTQSISDGPKPQDTIVSTPIEAKPVAAPSPSVVKTCKDPIAPAWAQGPTGDEASGPESEWVCTANCSPTLTFITFFIEAPGAANPWGGDTVFVSTGIGSLPSNSGTIGLEGNQYFVLYNSTNDTVLSDVSNSDPFPNGEMIVHGLYTTGSQNYSKSYTVSRSTDCSSITIDNATFSNIGVFTQPD